MASVRRDWQRNNGYLVRAGYPAMTAMEKRMANSWNDAGAFMTVQDALQFYPANEGVEMIK